MNNTKNQQEKQPKTPFNLSEGDARQALQEIWDLRGDLADAVGIVAQLNADEGGSIQNVLAAACYKAHAAMVFLESAISESAPESEQVTQ